jgi:limonene-1,2-epoxide hydrolase
MTDIELVMEFIAACDARDIERVLSFFTPDCIYHNMPEEPLHGPEGVRSILGPFFQNSEIVEFCVHAMAQAPNGAVLTERTDRFLIGGKWLSLPVAGVFECKNGKITHWRDYYDSKDIQQQFASIGLNSAGT